MRDEGAILLVAELASNRGRSHGEDDGCWRVLNDDGCTTDDRDAVMKLRAMETGSGATELGKAARGGGSARNGGDAGRVH
ncbi:hypothetical protein SESBI_40500 [Sesbania bispinosa]|nr:hypothetical protein SESBI_40500 [Sesbania bispinosa]